MLTSLLNRMPLNVLRLRLNNLVNHFILITVVNALSNEVDYKHGDRHCTDYEADSATNVFRVELI